MPRPKGSKNAPPISLEPLDFDAALAAIAETGPPPVEPVEAEKRADKKAADNKRRPA